MSENRFDPVAHARSMRDGGFWVDKNFDEFLQQTVAATPGKLALLVRLSQEPSPPPQYRPIPATHFPVKLA